MKFCWVSCPWWAVNGYSVSEGLLVLIQPHLSKWINCSIRQNLSPQQGEQRGWSDLVFLLALMGEVLNFIFIHYLYYDARKRINLRRKSRRAELQSQRRLKSKENQRALCWDYWHNEQSQRLRGYSWAKKTCFSGNHWSTNCSDASSKSSDLERLVSLLPWWGDIPQ